MKAARDGGGPWPATRSPAPALHMYVYACMSLLCHPRLHTASPPTSQPRVVARPGLLDHTAALCATPRWRYEAAAFAGSIPSHVLVLQPAGASQKATKKATKGPTFLAAAALLLSPQRQRFSSRGHVGTEPAGRPREAIPSTALCRTAMTSAPHPPTLATIQPPASPCATTRSPTLTVAPAPPRRHPVRQAFEPAQRRRRIERTSNFTRRRFALQTWPSASASRRTSYSLLVPSTLSLL